MGRTNATISRVGVPYNRITPVGLEVVKGMNLYAGLTDKLPAIGFSEAGEPDPQHPVLIEIIEGAYALNCTFVEASGHCKFDPPARNPEQEITAVDLREFKEVLVAPIRPDVSDGGVITAAR